MRLFALVVVVVVGCCCCCRTSAADFQHETLIDDRVGVRLRWTLSGDDLVMQMEARVGGYVAVGWSKSGRMVESFAAFGSDGQAPVELVLTSKGPGGIVPAADQPLRNGSVRTANGRTTMTFTRPVRHGQRPVPVGHVTDMIWAVHDSQPTGQHTAMGAFTVDLAAGAVRTQTRGLLIAHGLIMFAAFVVVFPVGVVWARFRAKADTDRIARHRQLQGLGAVLAVVGFGLVVGDVGADGAHFAGLHAIAGLVVMVATAAQMTVAAARPAFGSAWRPAWLGFHLATGRLLFLAGPVVAFFGAGLYGAVVGPALDFLFVLVVAVTIAIWAVAVGLWVRERRLRDAAPRNSA